MRNALYVGDEVDLTLPWASESFSAVITGFEDRLVKVRAVEVSDDPCVDNEWAVPWRSVVPRVANG